MLIRRRIAAAFCCLTLLFSESTFAADWLQTSVKVAGGGTLDFEFPDSWGKKPAIDAVDGLSTVRFGPFGPKRKPVFSVQVESITAVNTITDEVLMKEIQAEVENYKTLAAEANIPINELQGDAVSGHYFSITDRQSKIGEFDYLTLAVLRADRLLIKCFFFSSDGAPDFGADAIQMMRSLKYTAPLPKPEGKKKK